MSDATLEALRARLKSGEDPGDTVLRKQYTADQIKAEGDRTFTFTISTGAVDRQRDTVAVNGWDFSNFLKGGPGPVLWAHSFHDLPIGKAPFVKVQGSAVKARVEFAPAEANPLAESVRQLIEFGALKAASVGFRSKKSAFNEDRGGIDFLEQELLEFSIVPVPANPDALVEAREAGIDSVPVVEWAEKVLEAHEPGVWVPKRGLVEAMRVEADRVDVAQIRDGLAELGERVGKLIEIQSQPAPEPPAVISTREFATTLGSVVSKGVSAAVAQVTGRLD